MKKILIVGSTSVVGLSAGKLLARQNHIYYAGRCHADYPLELNSLELDFPEDLQFDVVIHAAADFGENINEWRKTETVNAIGTLNVCRLAKKVQAMHVIVISSYSAAYAPNDPYYGIYSLSKRHADELAQLYCQQVNLPLTILRPTQIYDAQSKCKSHQKLFYSIIEKAQNGEDIVFYGNNDAFRNYIFLDDFSEIIAKTIGSKITGTFDCPGSESFRLSEVAQTALQIFGRGGSVHFQKDKPDLFDVTGIPSDALYRQLNYVPGTSLLEGIKKIKQARGFM